MKFYKVLLLSAFAFATISCMDDQFDEGGNDCQMQSVLLEANISGESEITKTGMTSDNKGAYDPYWKPDDCIGVVSSNRQTNVLPTVFYNEKFKNQSKEKSKTTSFAGKITFAADHIYAYYPYTKSKLKADANSIRVDVNIPNVQFPGADTFDGNADFMYTSKTNVPSSTDNSVKTSMSVDFIRASRFLKIIFRDDTKDQKFKTEHVKSVRIEAGSSAEPVHLAGTYRFDLVNSSYAKLVNKQTNVITAMHVGADNQYVVNGTNGTFVGVYPSLIPKGTDLHIECTTDNYIFTKDVTLNQDLPLENGKFSVLGIKIEDGTFRGVSSPKEAGTAWKNFVNKSADNVLHDFSYAGYCHGEHMPSVTMPNDMKNSPAKVTTYIVGDGGNVISTASDYKIFNVEDYGADGKDEKSDRNAFLKALAAARVYDTVEDGQLNGTPKDTVSAKAIIYFPEGRFILHDDTDNTDGSGLAYDSMGHQKSNPIYIYAGDLMIKGAGRDKTTLVMATENLPDDNNLYSSPKMIEFATPKDIAFSKTIYDRIGQQASRGSKTVGLATDRGIASGNLVCLTLNQSNPNSNPTWLQNEELGGHQLETWMSSIANRLEVVDFHRVINKEGKELTFYEPLMREVTHPGDWKWLVRKCDFYQNIGVEDLTFEGNAKEDFCHHASWKDDGGFKPLQFSNVSNAWLRRVGFKSISECAIFSNCANCTAIDIEISGRRGHAGVRAMGSSRVFLGKIYDHSYGKVIEQGQVLGSESMDDAGQYHASGVSKPSIGTVLWRNHWGRDATFESHSSQPRATLVDCCKGGWVEWRFGGADKELPNHLDGLTIWNMEVTRFYGRPEQQVSYQFWDTRRSCEKWRVAPPVVVGFHGNPQISFDNESNQMKHFESPGKSVTVDGISSLYEAQLKKRLKYIPDWLEKLKAINY